jgi:hypothetical protein
MVNILPAEAAATTKDVVFEVAVVVVVVVTPIIDVLTLRTLRKFSGVPD